MPLPSFILVRPHSAAPGQHAWELRVAGVDISGYTDDDGTPRDLMVHFPGFALITAPETFGYTNGVVLP